MNQKTRRIIKKISIVTVSVALGLFLAGKLISYFAVQKIRERLTSVGCKAENLTFNLYSGTVRAQDFSFNIIGDTAGVPHTGEIHLIAVKNINLYQLIFNKRIQIREILIENGAIRINEQPLTQKKDSPSDSSGDNVAFKGITIGRITIHDLQTTVVDDTVTRYSAFINEVTVGALEWNDSTGPVNIKAFTLKTIDTRISKVAIRHLSDFYEAKISAIHINNEQQKITIDSFLLIPKYEKYEFSKVAGKQIDRINTSIPKIAVDGVQFGNLADSSFLAERIVISGAEVYSFRDKRQPFLETKVKPLPMEALKGLQFSIAVDTIRIHDSKISYEEFPEEGFESGTMVFEDLTATLTNLKNRLAENEDDNAMLKASANLMGQGLIEASFTLPLAADKPYHAAGKIGKMSLSYLNPVLKNLAFINVESGTLNGINFDFDYTDAASTGRLTINYENLKINGLKKEKSTVINDIKSFIINTILKNDKDKTTPTANRTGDISFERDKQRQIFNYWWKSLLSGIKKSVL